MTTAENTTVEWSEETYAGGEGKKRYIHKEINCRNMNE